MSDQICRCGHHKRRHNPTKDWCWGCDSCTGFRADLTEQLSIDDALGDVIPSRSTDPETSHAAAREIRVKAGSQRARLLWAFYDSYQCELDTWTFIVVGLTDEEAMRSAAGVSPTSEYSKRCSELRDGGFIEPTGETRPGSAGPQRIVSRITAKGRAWVEANR